MRVFACENSLNKPQTCDSLSREFPCHCCASSLSLSGLTRQSSENRFPWSSASTCSARNFFQTIAHATGESSTGMTCFATASAKPFFIFAGLSFAKATLRFPFCRGANIPTRSRCRHNSSGLFSRARKRCRRISFRRGLKN